MARLTLLVVSPDAPPTLARHFGWRRPTLEVASPDASACVARNKRDSRPTLSDLSPDTRRSASRGFLKRQTAVEPSHFSRKVGSGVACIALATFCGRPPNPLGDFGRPIRRLRWTDRGTSVNRLCRPGGPTLPLPTGDNSNRRGALSLLRYHQTIMRVLV